MENFMGSELESSIASKIGGELLKSVGGAMAGAAMGQVLSSIGMGDDGTKKALEFLRNYRKYENP